MLRRTFTNRAARDSLQPLKNNMIASTNAVAKIAAVVAGLGLVAMSFASFAPAARAATTAELEAQVQALLAQIAAMNGGSSSSSTTFTMDLTLGSSGAEVTALQNWLIKQGQSIPAGATGYFGAQTQSALAAWQAANGITPASGYFGPITLAKVNGMGGGSMGGDDSDSDLSGGEASLEDLNANDGEEDEVELGSSAKVAEFEVDVEDADIELQRLDLTFDSSAVETGDDDEPWDAFGEVTVYIDGEEVASEDVSEEDDWLDNDGTNGEYVFRFAGLNTVIEEGETALIEVEVEADGGGDIDAVTANLSTWELYIDTDGLRGTDGEGIEQYIGDSTENVTFDIVEEGADDELDVQSSSDDPNATVFQVETSSVSDWYTVFAFELEADEEGSDIELNTIEIPFGTTDSDARTVVNDAKLVIDGEEFDDFDWSTEGAASSTVFDIDGDFTVESGETVTVELAVEFKAQTSNYAAGTTFSASTTGSLIDAEGADDVTPTGSASSETHTLQTNGINVTPADDSAAGSVVEGTDNDYATFTIEVEVEAFEDDIFIDDTSAAFTYRFENAGTGAAFATTSATTSQSVTSTASIESGYYRVGAGDMETFTYTFTLDPEAGAEGNQYRAQLLTILFNDSAAAPDTTWTANPANDYETSAVLIAD